MTWVSFALGVFFGVFVTRLWIAISGAWGRVSATRVALLEPQPADQGLPRALIRTAFDEFHVRQMAPSGYLVWLREDTGEPVSTALDTRLHMLLTIARASTVPGRA